ncbi:hypothetical protein V5O48_012352 [Marasmius crinis-equi]|uniref:Uncharacterized protein n=1 Tax=Marasmius crinis-equi TaxID=585013 RepID=A0ABR3F3M8_9AGAR
MACEAIVSLSAHMKSHPRTAGSQMQPQWGPSVLPWFAFFLRNVFYARPDAEAHLGILEHFIVATPDLLDVRDRSGVMGNIKWNTASCFRPLIAQIWILLLHKEHPTFREWTELLNDITIYLRITPSASSVVLSPTLELWNLPLLYPVDADLGKFLLGQLDFRLSRLRAMEADELRAFKSFLVVFSSGKHCLRDLEGRGDPVCATEENYSSALHSMGRILRIVLRKWTSLHRLTVNDPEVLEAYGIVNCVLLALSESIPINTPDRVQRIVESGIIKSLYYAPDLFYAMDGVFGAPGATFVEGVTEIIDKIAIFLVHYRVLKPFTRDSVKFRGEYLDNLPPRLGEWKALAKAWSNILAKADELYTIRCTLKTKGLCFYGECPISMTEGSIQHAKRQTGSNITERSVPYWHKPLKRSLAYQNDLRLHNIMLKAYLSTRSERFTSMLNDYRSSHPSAQHLQTRNPILWINFDRPDLPPTEEAHIIDVHAGVNSRWNRSLQDQLRDREVSRLVNTAWEGTTSAEVLVWAVIPLHTGIGAASYHATLAVAFPFKGDGVDTGHRWLRGSLD